ncbi:uncharacterized protein TNCV_4291841 [Trichonephila clavipes]|uniref:Uncharacterized protein n=1 Tax=Trichonephila clavipes TaxID=2585209 RepID=A0A8X6V002_TRICX|nr:uncharacterized protein TNCV_4291841 [Trichonephila clavipes]
MSTNLVPLKTHRVEGIMHVSSVEAGNTTVDVSECLLRPRSCSVPRVTLDSSPITRSATTEGSYNLGDWAFPELGSRAQMPSEERALFRLLLEWGQLCPDDLLLDNRREVEEFLDAVGGIGEQYRRWTNDIRSAFGLQENDADTEEKQAEAIRREYETNKDRMPPFERSVSSRYASHYKRIILSRLKVALRWEEEGEASFDWSTRIHCKATGVIIAKAPNFIITFGGVEFEAATSMSRRPECGFNDFRSSPCGRNDCVLEVARVTGGSWQELGRSLADGTGGSGV